MKKSFLAIIIVIALVLSSCSVLSSNTMINVTDWKYKLGDNHDWCSESLDTSDWTPFVMPSDIALPKGGQWFWLRTEVDIPSSIEIPAYIEVSRTVSSFEMYIDGNFVGSRTGLPPKFFSRGQIINDYLIPETYFNDGKIVIALRCFYVGTFSDFEGVSIVNTSAVEKTQNLRNFLMLRLNIILTVLCVFMGVYFLAQFFAKKSETSNLFFALSLLLVAFYFFDIGAEYTIMNAMYQRVIAKICLSSSLSFMLLFFTKFFESKLWKISKIFAIVNMLSFSVIYLIFAYEDHVVDMVFTISLLPIFIIMLTVFIISIQHAKKGQIEAKAIVIGISAGLAFGVHDIVYQIMNLTPYAWLQGLSFFMLNLSVFVALSLRASLQSRKLDNYASEVKKQSDKLSELLSEIAKTAQVTSQVSLQLNEEVKAVSEAADKSSASADGISNASTQQKDTLLRTAQAIKELINSISSVETELNNEAETITSSISATNDIINGIKNLGSTMDSTASFAKNLDELSQSGKKSMINLSNSMTNIKDSSAEIKQVVFAVNEFADQTNLLAMNASIEAAHAGNYGKGFAVIAQEIKKLAQASAERSSKIGDMVSKIEKAVTDGVKASELVHNSFSRISSEAETTAKMVVDASLEAKRQIEQGERVANESRSLSESSLKVKNEGERQTDLSIHASKELEGLEKSALLVLASSKEIVKVNKELVARINGLEELSNQVKQASTNLLAVMKN